MIQRKEETNQLFQKNGESIEYRWVDQLLTDDHLILGMKRYLYTLVTNKEAPKTPSDIERKVKYYLTRNYVYYK